MKVIIDIDEDKFELVQMTVINGLKSSDMVYKAVAMGTIIDDDVSGSDDASNSETKAQ